MARRTKRNHSERTKEYGGRTFRDPRGCFLVPRRVFKAERDGAGKIYYGDDLLRLPLSEWEAWQWLVESAAWEAEGRWVRRRSVRGKRDAATVYVAHGCCLWSCRYLGEAWGWSKSGTGRFLGRLRRDARIATTVTDYGTSIRVLNYAAYQDLSFYRRAGSGTPQNANLGRRPDVGGTKTYKVLSSTEIGDAKTVKRTSYPQSPEQIASAVKRAFPGATIRATVEHDATDDTDPWNPIVAALKADVWNTVPLDVRANMLRSAKASGPAPPSIASRLPELEPSARTERSQDPTDASRAYTHTAVNRPSTSDAPKDVPDPGAALAPAPSARPSDLLEDLAGVEPAPPDLKQTIDRHMRDLGVYPEFDPDIHTVVAIENAEPGQLVVIDDTGTIVEPTPPSPAERLRRQIRKHRGTDADR